MNTQKGRVMPFTEIIPTEHEEQRDVVRWFRYQAFRGVMIFAVPNGGMRSKATAQKLKLEGVLPGVPDLFIPAWRLWVEMKRVRKGTVSPEQKAVMAELEAMGYSCIVCRGAEDAKRQILHFVAEHGLEVARSDTETGLETIF